MKQHSPTQTTPWLWLGLIIAFFLFNRLYLFVGIVGSDDVSIAGLALDVLNDGFYLPYDHYSARIGLIYPQALVFALFGVGEWQMAALPMLASMVGLLLAYKMGEHYGDSTTGLLAALLIALFPLDAYFSSQLMPDLPLGTTLALSIYLMLRAEAKQSAGLAVLAGLVWGWAYLIKVEAFFLVFVVLTLWAMRQLSWRTVFITGASVATVVLAENVAYYIASGEALLRVHLATVQGGGKFAANTAIGAGELWVFPKSWFLTPYYFGLHYYALFGAMLWLLIRRQWVYLALITWVTIYLLWLQFGGNPFREDYKVKTHLERYCNMLNVPMALLIALAVQDIQKRFNAKASLVIALPIFLLPLLFLPFNQLSAERQISTKQLLDVVRKEQLFPLYLDRTSLTLANMYLYDEAQAGKLHTLQEHNFKTRETIVTKAEDIQGYVLINRGFVDYGKGRYDVDTVRPADYQPDFETHTSADNPLPGLSYASAKVLRWGAGFIPLEFFRNKIQNTADALLEGEDAVLMRSSK